MAGVVGVAISAPIAAGAAMVGSQWALRYAFLVFVVATILAIRLPPRVDSSQGEESIAFLGGDRTEEAPAPGARGRVRIPGSMAFALRANCGPRWLSGFLTLFMAFLLREHPIGGYSPQFLLAVVIGGAGLGNIAGIAIGILRQARQPRITVVAMLLADVAAVALAALCSTASSRSWSSGSPPAWPSAWPSSRSTPPSSATCPSGCTPSASRAATPRSSWRG